ncbi:MAG: DinB family protein [Christiangramia sp.]|nr:DinB family protein [Christiangramia sp.]
METKQSKTIARIWHGKTKKEKADEYLSILNRTGIADYRKAKGIKSVKILQKDTELESHFWVISEWEDKDSVNLYTSGNWEEAQYYDEDEEFLLEKEEHVRNLESYSIFGEMFHYIQALEGLFSGHNWTCVSLDEILNDIPFDKAVKNSLPNRHNIFEILHHSLTWRLFLLSRLKGPNNLSVKQNDENDWPEVDNITAENWFSLKENYLHIQKELLENLRKKDDQLLDEKVPERSYNYRYLINGIIQHDYYHLGQISLLK